MTWIDNYPNASYAYSYELAEGFTPAQASGILGNLITESGINPEAIQPNGPGRGIAQWSQGGRWQPRLMTGNPKVDLPNQLAFIMQELETNPGYGLADLKASQTPEQAAQIFGTDFERYGIAGNRVKDARDVYNALAIGGGAGLPVSSVPTAQLTSGSINPLDPLTWAGGISGLGGLFGVGASIGDTASGLASIATNFGKFLAVIMYGGTWIRFGEAILGVVVLSGGMALLLMTLASSPGTLTALGSVASLFPGEGTAAALAAKTAAGARAAGGRQTTLSRFAGGAKAEGSRRRTAAESKARAARAESDRRESRRSSEHVARHKAFQASQASYRRSLNLYEKAKERDARADEDEELFSRSRGQARANRTGYNRQMSPFSDTRDLRRRTA